MGVLYTILIIALIVFIILVARGTFRDFFENKKPSIIISVVLIIIFGISKVVFSSNADKIESLKRQNELQMSEQRDNSDKIEEDLKKQLSEETGKVNVAKEYLSLNSAEKKIIDDKITEVKAATEAEKAKIIEEKEKKEAEEKAKKEAEEKTKKEAEEKAKKEAEAKKYETGITWEDMARDKNGKIGNYARLSGKILQVINGDGYNQYRMAVNSDYDKVILIQISKTMLDTNILEDDLITVEGMCTGNISYKTVLGAENTIPSLSVNNFYYQ